MAITPTFSMGFLGSHVEAKNHEAQKIKTPTLLY